MKHFQLQAVYAPRERSIFHVKKSQVDAEVGKVSRENLAIAGSSAGSAENRGEGLIISLGMAKIRLPRRAYLFVCHFYGFGRARWG